MDGGGMKKLNVRPQTCALFRFILLSVTFLTETPDTLGKIERDDLWDTVEI